MRNSAEDYTMILRHDIHGLLNDGDDGFIYISVTAPPIHFGYAYNKEN